MSSKVNKFIVCVEFEVHPQWVEQFSSRVCKQAEDSLALESSCHVFTVSVDPARSNRFFLYEEYGSEDAFKHHLESAHFKSFDRECKDWVIEKIVNTYQRIQ